MPYKALTITAILLIGIAFAWWDQTRAPSIIKAPKETYIDFKNTPAPDIQFTTLNGTAHKLNDFKNKIILVNFWATWCAPCIAEFPALLQLAQQNPDTLVLIALSVDEEPQKIAPFFEKFDSAAQNNLNLSNVLIGHDNGKTISQDAFQTVMYPETYIIGPDMIIRRKIAGVTDWAGDDMGNYLKSLLPRTQNSETLP